MNASQKNSQFKIIEIAGQKNIQIKVCQNINNTTSLKDIHGCTVLYSWKMPTDQNSQYFALDIKTEKLLYILDYLSQNNISIQYIHDF